MWLAVKVIAVLVVLIAVGLGALWQRVFAPGPLPALREEWWGPGQPRNVPEDVTPFNISVPQSVIQDLHARLDGWKNPTKPLENAYFTYGFNTDFLKKVVRFWRSKYDWKEREAFLNSLPQFKTNIAGLNIHFIHVKPKAVPAGTRVLPLLALHGWPGSVRELYDMIPMLTTPRPGHNFVFEVIAPSLPGYGFSDGAVRPGLGAAQVAVVMRQLMQRIGFQQFYIHGGDWGGIIASHMATLSPQTYILLMHWLVEKNYMWLTILNALMFSALREALDMEHSIVQTQFLCARWYLVICFLQQVLPPRNTLLKLYFSSKAHVLGMHSNMCVSMHPLSHIMYLVGQIYPLLLVDPPYQDRVYPLSNMYSFLVEETGYMHIQATKPDTVGVGLRDSPVGLAAYILEKFSTWTDKKNKGLTDGGLTEKFTLTSLLDNIMIYWVTDSITTSMRLYSESFNSAQMGLGLDKIPSFVPTACTAAPEELAYTPKAVLLLKFTNLLHYTHLPKGGHFVALEEPQLLADDLWEGVSKILKEQGSL